MNPEFIFYALAIPAVLIAGLSKGGFGGSVGMVATPMIAIAVPPVQAAAIMLPVLVVMDLVGLWSYRRLFKWSIVAQMMPGALGGVVLGWATASRVDDNVLRVLVGLIAIGFAVSQFLAGRAQRPPASENAVKASFWGAVAGYTSFVSHAGGPPFQAYALPLRLDKLRFAGTSTVFFAMVNAAKLAPYFALGQFDRTNLLTSATLFPLAVIGVMTGVWAVRRVSQGAFYNITYLAMVLIGSKLVHDGLAALI